MTCFRYRRTLYVENGARKFGTIAFKRIVGDPLAFGVCAKSA